MTIPQRERLLGLDLIRLFSFIAIAYFHICIIHFHSDSLPQDQTSWVVLGIEKYARSLAFSGFTILFLSSLLTGFSGTKIFKRFRLLFLLFLGWVALCYMIQARVSLLYTWDIYLLIIVGIAAACCAEWVGRRTLRALALIGFVVLWIPVWELGDFFEQTYGMPPIWQSVLGFASCTISISEWPLFPWVGMIWFGYGIGVELKSMKERGEVKELNLAAAEVCVWAVLLGLSLPRWGAFYNIPLVEFFRCDAYKLPPLTFWSHMVWPIFLIRISFDGRVQTFLRKFRLVAWVSRLAISTDFWLAYAMHYILALIISFVIYALRAPTWSNYENVIIFAAIIFFPLIELSMRACLKILGWLRKARLGLEKI